MQNLYVLVYVSAAVVDFSDNALESLLVKSRENNTKLGITGLLLYSERSFIQAIEGDKEVIDNLYKKISNDKRHKLLIKIYEKPIEERLFPEWSMGLKKVKKEEIKALPGFSHFMDEKDFDDEELFNSSKVMTLLNTFKKYN